MGEVSEIDQPVACVVSCPKYYLVLTDSRVFREHALGIAYCLRTPRCELEWLAAVDDVLELPVA